MTTIGCDGEHVWADSQVTQDEMKGVFRKVHRIISPDGPVVVAFAGEVDIIPGVLSAIRSGLPVDGMVTGKSTVLLASLGELRVVSGKKSWADTPPIFIGSGAAAARGAYAVCGDVAQSVRAACKVDLYSSVPIRRVKI